MLRSLRGPVIAPFRDVFPYRFPRGSVFSTFPLPTRAQAGLYVPSVKSRLAAVMDNTAEPRWFHIYAALAARDTYDEQLMLDSDLVIVGASANWLPEGGSANQSLAVQVQCYQVGQSGSDSGQRWSLAGVYLENFAGTGALPMIFRYPYFCAEGLPLVVRLVNTAVVGGVGVKTTVNLTLHCIRRRGKHS